MFNRVAETGFTIIELVTVLAVTGAMFIGAVSLIQTQNAHSQFAQAVNDLDNRLNKYVTDLHSGYDPATTDKYSCTGYPSRPLLSTTTPGLGTNPACLFLGKAIQVNPGTGNDNLVYIYTVVGNRTMKDPSNPAGQVPIDSFSHALPTQGCTSAPPSATCVTDTYSIPFGARVLSSTYTVNGSTISSKSNLVGFYNSLDDSGAASQLTKAYSPNSPIGGSPTDPYTTYCIQEDPSNCPNIYSFPSNNPATLFSKWALCLSYTGNTARLTIIPTSAGIRTQVNYVGCS